MSSSRDRLRIPLGQELGDLADLLTRLGEKWQSAPKQHYSPGGTRTVYYIYANEDGTELRVVQEEVY